MPLYDYRCENDHVAEDVFHLMHDTTPICCAVCGQVMSKLPALAHTSMKAFAKPIEMFSIAMEDQEEIRAFKRKAPDVECSDDPRHPDYGLPIAHSRHSKLQALKAAGYVETK